MTATESSHGTVMVVLWLLLPHIQRWFDFEIFKMFKQKSKQQSAGTDGSKNSHISGKWCSSLQTLLQHGYLLMMVGW